MLQFMGSQRVGHFKDSKQKLLEPINEFIKEAGYKINIQKTVSFLYTNNDITLSFKKFYLTTHQKTSRNKFIQGSKRSIC